jgi:ubiquitin carboxyl-terminal hydrolase L5
LALGNIEERILQPKNGVDYSLLSVCQSPLRTVLKNLAENIGSISSVANFLTTIAPDWRHFTGVDDPMLIEGPDTSFGISQDLLDNFGLPQIVQQRIGDAGDDVTKLLNLYKEWATDQIQLRASYINEAASTGQDDEQARRGKEDFTSAIYTSIKTLSKQGILPDIVNEVCEN